MGLPVATSNEKLAALQNTFAELSDAVMASQKARLQNTAAGRAILHRTGTATELRALDGQRSLPPEGDPYVTVDGRKWKLKTQALFYPLLPPLRPCHRETIHASISWWIMTSNVAVQRAPQDLPSHSRSLVRSLSRDLIGTDSEIHSSNAKA
ncbi:hypothetical protein HPB49_012928 [Dermacentor silvarum]|uniref:Uncharacterized protein n=1 Tax=Dermacentor silvarum TaxID=543639 RepID=A0ACB8E047_DERSI|nr:hypothetical protein HPB49_012928 [Dermacentor silvarum]